MFSSSIENQKILKGCIYSKDGRCCAVYIENTMENIAAFIARASNVPKVELIDIADCFVLGTMGSYLDSIFDQGEFRVKLLEKLIPMQTGELDIPEIKVSDDNYEEMYGVTKEEYLKWITENTGYVFR